MALQNNGVTPDEKTAAAYFQRSADLGYPEAQYALAIMVRNGGGVPQDAAKAASLMKAAADNDSVAAQVEYGIMLFNGLGVAKDEAGAGRYFIKAAGHSNPVAQDRAARLYVAGRGVKKDLVEGMKWHLLSKAAGLKDDWLDGEMTKLTPEQRQAVDAAVRRYVGS
jgi:TPR repeat protein